MLSFLLGPEPDLDAILSDTRLKGAVVSAIAIADDGRELFARNADTYMVPASNQKILSTVYAWVRLGPAYIPTTRIWKIGGNLVIDAPGDPTLTTAQFEEARRQLKLKGAPLALVHQAYAPGVPPSWEHDDLPNKYAARITALTVDRGAFALRSDQGKVEAIRSEFGVRMDRGIRTGPVRVDFQPFAGQVTIEGELPAARTVLDTLALPRPDWTAARLLGARATEVTNLVPSTGPDVAIQGWPIQRTITECLNVSDNCFAENLLLMAAASEGGLDPRKPYAVAGQRLENFLTKDVGLGPDFFKPVDGSGMSRHNLVTTRGLTSLLSWVGKQSWGESYFNSMVVGGKGTLGGRLKGSSFRGKTGTLNRVTSLSGQVTGKDGKRIYLSMIINNCPAPASAQREMLDRFVLVCEGKSWQGSVSALHSGHGAR